VASTQNLPPSGCEPPKTALAKAWFTTATSGASLVSRSSNVRPASSATPIVLK
jgi:hypothetical protein